MWVLYGELLWDPRVSSSESIPAGFCSQDLWGVVFLALETCAGWPSVCLGLLTPKISLSSFYLPHMGEGLGHSSSPPQLPVWMDVVSLIL